MTGRRNKESAPVATREGDRLRHAGRERQATPRVRSACATLAARDARARTCDSPPRAAATPSNPRGDGTLFRWKRQRRGCNFFDLLGPESPRRDTASSGCVDRSTSLQATHDPTTRVEAKDRADRPRPLRILKPTVAPPSLREGASCRLETDREARCAARSPYKRDNSSRSRRCRGPSNTAHSTPRAHTGRTPGR